MAKYYDEETATIKLPDQNERRQMMNSMPNELRELVKRVEASVAEADSLLEHGVVSDAELNTFFTLVYIGLADDPNRQGRGGDV